MGAFVITLVISRIAPRFVGYDARGAISAFLIALVLTVGLATFGFSGGPFTPLQVLPFVALGYGKFCLAYLIVDLDFAKRLKANPELINTVGSFKPNPTMAWLPAAAVIAIGAAVSFSLPGVDIRRASRAVNVQSGPSRPVAPPSVVPEGDLLVSEAGLFTVWMPSKADETSEVVENPTGRPPILTHMFYADMGDSAYGLTYMRFEDAHIDPSATVERVLEHTRDSMMSRLSGTVTEQHFVEYQGYPALDVAFTIPVAGSIVVGRSREVMAGRTIYTLLALGGSPSTASRVLDSFVITGTSDGFRLRTRGATPPQQPTRQGPKSVSARAGPGRLDPVSSAAPPPPMPPPPG